MSITNDDYVLSHVELGSEHHKAKQGIITDLCKKAIRDKETKIDYSKKDIECSHEDCPLEAAIIVPIISAEEDIGLIKFYFKKVNHIRPVEHVLAEGIGHIISNQLKIMSHEKLEADILDDKLRA